MYRFTPGDRLAPDPVEKLENWSRCQSDHPRSGLMVSVADGAVLRQSIADGMQDHVRNFGHRIVADCWHWLPQEKIYRAQTVGGFVVGAELPRR